MKEKEIDKRRLEGMKQEGNKEGMKVEKDRRDKRIGTRYFYLLSASFLWTDYFPC